MSNQTKQLPTTIDWAPILFHLKKQHLIPFLGAGASLGFNGDQGLPTGGQLAEKLATECAYPGRDKADLMRVTQYYALKFGEMPLRDSIQQKLCLPNVKPGKMHQIMASWPIKAVLTTNYDNLMERAFIKHDKDPVKIIYDRRGDQEQIKTEPTQNSPLVYKLHGSLDDIDSMVITEDNYIDFLISLIQGNPKVPDLISTMFRTCSILFIGYGLKDWNIRVLLRYFRTTDIRSFAIQCDPEADLDKIADREWENSVLYWEHKKISVFNCDALKFVTELDKQYREALANESEK